MKNMKKFLALALAGATAFTSAFAGYAVEAEANDGYVADADLQDNETAAPAADEIVPDANQYRYQKEELSAFCHFGPNTFNEIEWGEHYGNRHPSEIFTLKKDFDADTMVSTLKDAGFEKLIVTAKHHDGFCIWDSAHTDYDVAASGYQDADGNSDILAEISAACTKYDMDMGLYLSPWDIHEPSYGSVDGDAYNYNEFYNNQLIEILSQDEKYGNNGHFNEVWMDGAKGSGAYAQDYDFERWFATIQKYEGKEAGFDADCMLFGAEAYTTVRWIGNESGLSGEQTWSKSVANFDNNTVDHNRVEAEHFNYGFANGNIWTVPEADARITSGWFWGTQKNTPKTIADLATMYFNSVGHNSVFLLNVPPNNQGTVDEAILNRVTEFGNEVRDTFAKNYAADGTVLASEVRGNDVAYKPSNVIDGNDATYWTTNDGTTEGSLIVDLGGTKSFDVVSIEEAIQFGQRIKSFKVEYKNSDDTEWKLFDEGTTVGAKRLSRKAAVKADQIKITVSTAVADDTYVSNHGKALAVTTGVPMISEVGVFKASEGFELVGGAPLGMEVIDIRDFTLNGSWTDEAGGQYINGTNSWANGNSTGNVTAEVKFTGTKAYMIGTIDPNHGTADVYVDGEFVETINTNKGSRSVNQVLFASGDLTDGEHTVKFVCKSKAIGLEAAYVINNGGLGMVGIEEKEYTMDENSEIEVKIVRVGGTDKEVTVVMTPNPGSAIQDDFDTELIETVTFAAGETEKTARVKTRRNTNETGKQYFTVELSCADSNVILGFNAKAKVFINDSEQVEEPGHDTENAFVFPYELNEAKVLEAEVAVLTNSGENEQWPLAIAENSWASGGKFVNCLNRGDKIEFYYMAHVAGTYEVTATYRSGSDTNYLAWSEASGKITSGTVSAGANDGAGANHTVTFDLVVEEPGAGVLVFAPTTADSPQLDKFDIVLKEINEEVPSIPTTTPEPDDDSKDIDVALLTATTGNAQVLGGNNSTEGPAEFVLDNNTSTLWHTDWNGSDRASHWITLEVSDAYDAKVNGLRYLPRGNAGGTDAFGVITSYEVEVSKDGETWETVAEGTWANDPSWKAVYFDAQDAKYVRLTSVASVSDHRTFTSAAEIRLTGEVTEAPQPSVTEAPQPSVTEAPQPSVTEAPQPSVTEAPQPTETPGATEDVKTVFSDVHKDWYTDYVQYVYDNGLMTGIKGTTQFQPNANITKAQVAQVLYNMENQPEVADRSVFTDLKDVYKSEWYADAVAWAYNTGVVTGDLTTKKFNPNADVTREQLALMMFRYAQYKKYDTSATSDFAGLANAHKVASWSKDGVKWAVGAGLVSGVEKNGVKDLDPQGNASRAQMAAILQRFCENAAK